MMLSSRRWRVKGIADGGENGGTKGDVHVDMVVDKIELHN